MRLDWVMGLVCRLFYTIFRHLITFVVDLVESGDTMRAAGLHAIDTLLPSSQAVLISASSPKPLSVRTPEEQSQVNEMIKLVKNRIAGVIASSKFVLCQYNVSREKLQKALVCLHFTLKKGMVDRDDRKSLPAVEHLRSVP